MTTRPIVARGRIKVDARKAVAKLREHLLIDLHHWVLEIARAAVASGAKQLSITHDSDDFVLEWHGEPFGDGELARLLDYVLSSAEDLHGQRLRLLALGVNAALGLTPAFVDVYGVHGDRCQRVRFEPTLLEGGPDAEPSSQTVALPTGLGHGGTRVQLHRRLGWDVVRRAASGLPAREIGVIDGACRDLHIGLVLDGENWPAVSTERSLLSVPLVMRPTPGVSVRRAELMIVWNAESSVTAAEMCAPELVFLEHGVMLARYAFEPGEHYPSASHAGVSLPVRVVIDGHPLPTNASRSELRADASVVADAIEASALAFDRAVEAMVAVVTGAGTLPDGVRVHAEAGAIEEALGAVASVVAGAWCRGAALSGPASRLLMLPLLFDACGGRTSYAALGDQRPILVLDASAPDSPVREAPLEADLGPWMSRVVWRRGRTVERALDGMRCADASSLVTKARAARERRARFLAHAAGPVAVEPTPHHLVREDFGVDRGPLRGLFGQVALSALSGRGARIQVFHEGRALASLNVDAANAALPADIALEWKGQIVPTFGFDGVEDTESLKSAIGYAMMVAVLQADAIAKTFWEMSAEDAERVGPILRSAVATALARRAATGQEASGERTKALSHHNGLWRAPLWPTTEPKCLASLSEIDAAARARGALYVASPRATGPAPDGRAVLAADRAERELVVAALGGEIEVVPYDRGLLSAVGPARQGVRERALSTALEAELGSQGIMHTKGLPRVSFGDGAALGICSIAIRSGHVRMHSHVRLTTDVHVRTYGPVVLVSDDDELTPKPTWDGVLKGRRLPTSGAEHDLLATLVAALSGDSHATARLPPIPARWASDTSGVAPIMRHYLLCSAGSLGKEHAAASTREDLDERKLGPQRELLRALRLLPLLTVLDADGKPELTSLERALEMHPPPRPLPLLDAPVDFVTLDWRPLWARTEHDRKGVVAWAGSSVFSAEGELPTRRARAEEEMGLRTLLMQPAVAVNQFDRPVRSPSSVIVHEDESGLTVGLALAEGARVLSEVAVHHRGRLVCTTTLEWPGADTPAGLSLSPMARIEAPDPAIFESWRRLSRDGNQKVGPAVARAACALAIQLLGSKDTHDTLADPRVTALVASVLALRGRSWFDPNRLLRALRHEARWPTAQGGVARLTTLRRVGGEIYVASERHPGWTMPTRKSDLDEPVAYVPTNELGRGLAFILGEIGAAMRDVTAPMAALVQKRREKAETAPQLDGEPLHAELRASLERMHVAAGVGEMEIALGPGSEVVVSSLDLPGGKRLEHELAVPIRAKVHVDGVLSPALETRLADQLSSASVRMLESVMDRLDDKPRVVRSLVARMLVARLGTDRPLDARECAAAIFMDTMGGWHSASSLRAMHQEKPSQPVSFTTAPPPYPATKHQWPIMVIPESDVEPWRRVLSVPLRNVTRQLARELDGERKRNAPPLERCAITADVAARCLWVERIQESDLRGEIGILGPNAGELRGIHVAHGGRPLCVIEDGLGWPIHAVVDADFVKPSPHFDRIKTRAHEATLALRVRNAAMPGLKARLAAPADAAASVFFDERVPLASLEAVAADPGKSSPATLTVIGSLWIPARLPARPLVRVRARSVDAEVPLRRLFGTPGLEHLVPVHGNVLAWSSDPMADVHQPLVALAHVKLAAMVATLTGHGAAAMAYRWCVALSGGKIDPPLMAPTADGGHVDADRILAELGARGELWWTERRGAIDGDFPGGEPGFVLLAEGAGTSLLQVLTERLEEPEMLRELGGAKAPALSPRAKSQGAQASSWAAAAPRESSPASSSAESSPAAVDDAEEEESWLVGLVRRIVDAVAGSDEPLEGSDEIAAALGRVLGELDLGTVRVRARGRGRPVRVTDGTCIEINLRHAGPAGHPGLEGVRPTSKKGRRLVSVLAAAAACELNRAHERVTGSLERAALLTLLGRRV